MPKGAIHVNESARKYQFRLDSTSSYIASGTTTYSVTGYLRIYWGSTPHIQVKFENWFDGTVEHHQIVFSSPWAADTTVSGSGWVDPETILVEIDAGLLNVAEDCDYEFSFDEIRFRVGGTLEETIAADSDTGIGFDLRRDVVEIEAIPMELYAVPVCESSGSAASGVCGTDYAGYTETNVGCSIGLTAAYQWDTGSGWTSDEVREKAVPAIVDSACECKPTATWASFEPGHSNDSWYITLDAEYSNIITKTLGSLETRTCPGGYQIRQYWHYDQIFNLNSVEVHAIPTGSKIYKHRYYSKLDCGTHIDEQYSDVVETRTYVEQDIYGDRRTGRTWCHYLVDGEPCYDPGTDFDPPFPVTTDEWCCTKLTASVTWPDEPSCTEPTMGGVANSHTPYGFYMRAQSGASGILAQTKYGARPIAGVFDVSGFVTTDPDALNPCLDITPRLDIFCVYELSGTVYEAMSQDHCATWSTPVSVASGVNPRTGHDDAGSRWRAWFVYNSGSSGPGKMHIQSRAAGDTAYGSVTTVAIDIEPVGFDITAPPERQGAWIWAAVASGDTTPSEWKSTDFGVTWTLL
ncbi:MAG: hypothetical protein K8R88_09940 [Armatimonadetes bacterium]|nr:hypothetical protein [Armatimonadota bacterium]